MRSHIPINTVFFFFHAGMVKIDTRQLPSSPFSLSSATPSPHRFANCLRKKGKPTPLQHNLHQREREGGKEEASSSLPLLLPLLRCPDKPRRLWRLLAVCAPPRMGGGEERKERKDEERKQCLLLLSSLLGETLWGHPLSLSIS